MSTTFYDKLNPPPAERDTSQHASGTPRVRPLDELPAVAQELIARGPLAAGTITKLPATRAELLAELNSLNKEVCRAERRLAQIETELLTAV